MDEERPRGRPRSERARRAVLEAVADLLQEVGYDRLTIEAIAERAGVGRQTVYRWWRSKSDIVAEGLTDGTISNGPERVADTGDIRADLSAWLVSMGLWMADSENAALVRALAAATAEHDEAAGARYAELAAPDRERVVARLQAAVDAGQLRAGTDLEIAADVLLGAFVYRVLVRVPPTRESAEALVDLVLTGLT
ncbi:TetR/AcrR family transcriptional regulator [Naasia sp. SYSU D00057]|uniref:TetR/AcrR family transcriptional regulator n=1 Tax=Naasia sp. SYSU D00057 TaxID=2817380 RepID=UPI001B30AC68|nr:TetR/AcrR family transcriptional regulator [Naasia sp. SYSU D00057]